jgi:integrase
MTNITAKTDASKGSVSLQADDGRLRLQLPRQLFDGKRKYITLGLDDTPENRLLAEAKAKMIEADIWFERFDYTLAKYRPDYIKLVESATTPKEACSIVELWNKYAEVKRPSCAPGTWKNGYMVVSSHLSKCPFKTLEDAQSIFEWATSNLTADSAKRFIMQLNACCNWARKSKLIKENPFNGMTSVIKVPQSSNEDNDINPFSKAERDAIIKAFEDSRYYKHYAPYVKFLFYTGSRPSEAIALQWKHITGNTIIFEQAVVSSEDGLVLKEGLKTQKSRKFPINKQLRELLESSKTENITPESLVFPSPKGGWIDVHNFRNRAWKTILNSLNIEYRKPYQTRHTFISQQKANGVEDTQITNWVGTSLKMLHEHYAGTIQHVQVTEM